MILPAMVMITRSEGDPGGDDEAKSNQQNKTKQNKNTTYKAT